MTTDDKIFISLISTTGKVLLAESGEGTIMIEKQLHEISELFGYQLNILCLSEYLEITVYHGDEHIYHSIIQATPGIASLSRISAVKTLLYDINSGLTLEKANEKNPRNRNSTCYLPCLATRYRYVFFRDGICTARVCDMDGNLD